MRKLSLFLIFISLTFFLLACSNGSDIDQLQEFTRSFMKDYNAYYESKLYDDRYESQGADMITLNKERYDQDEVYEYFEEIASKKSVYTYFSYNFINNRLKEATDLITTGSYDSIFEFNINEYNDIELLEVEYSRNEVHFVYKELTGAITDVYFGYEHHSLFKRNKMYINYVYTGINGAIVYGTIKEDKYFNYLQYADTDDYIFSHINYETNDYISLKVATTNGGQAGILFKDLSYYNDQTELLHNWNIVDGRTYTYKLNAYNHRIPYFTYYEIIGQYTEITYNLANYKGWSYLINTDESKALYDNNNQEIVFDQRYFQGFSNNVTERYITFNVDIAFDQTKAVNKSDILLTNYGLSSYDDEVNLDVIETYRNPYKINQIYLYKDMAFHNFNITVFINDVEEYFQKYFSDFID